MIMERGARPDALPNARAKPKRGKTIAILRSSKRIFSTGLQVATQATTPQVARKPDRERARQAAIELWGTAGPPDHLSNLSICRDVAQWLKKNGQAADISVDTILRAVGRR